MKPGSRVGVTYREDHKHRGTLLSRRDPRAWQGSVLGANPTQREVDIHLAWVDEQCRKLYGADHRRSELPVLWDFGRIYWERACELFEVTA